WLNESRSFLIWKGTLEQARMDWLAAEKVDEALLMGMYLTRAKSWRNERGNDLGPDDLAFIDASEDREKRDEKRQQDEEAERLRLEADRLREEAGRQKAEAARIADQQRATRRFWIVAGPGIWILSILALFAWDRFLEASKEHHRALTTQSRDLAQ